MIFECITESWLPRDIFPPLWSRRNAPIEWFRVMKFSIIFGCDDCSQTTPLFLFYEIKFFLIYGRDWTIIIPYELLVMSFLAILHRPEFISIIPGPGLCAILFSTIIVWCDFYPPKAMLHYKLCDISFF